MNPLVDLTPTSQLQTEDDKNADFFESDVLFQMIGVIGWIILTASIIVLAWVSEPCITRITSRWKQAPRCVIETGNVNSIFGRLLASSNEKDGETQV